MCVSGARGGPGPGGYIVILMLAYFGLPNFKGMPKLYVAIRR